ncbi:MAG: hypothetical protein ABIC91_04520 [Nanoarchaeota archaeon]|nr:hypothetical protein [Nanoarchaeota archaeon]MBU1850433.1 hypothetical protein [Nanoarchaeota archaeon]
MVSMIAFNMFTALKEIGASFVREPSLWWFLTPIILLWVILEIYFGEYKHESLGWNTALGNAISLLWVTIESMRFLFANKSDNFWSNFVIIIVIMFYAFLIIYFVFTHKVSSKVAFALGKPSPICFLSLVTILWGHNVLTVSWWVALDLLILFFLLVLLFAIIRKLLPESQKDVESDSGVEDNFGSDSSQPKVGGADNFDMKDDFKDMNKGSDDMNAGSSKDDFEDMKDLKF